MGKFNSMSGKDKVRLIVSIVSLPVIVAVGVALNNIHIKAVGSVQSLNRRLEFAEISVAAVEQSLLNRVKIYVQIAY